MLDILIQNGTVVDGSGAPAFRADVGLVDGRVVAVADGIDHEAVRTIDATGLHVAPGFIDPHTHSDLTLLVDPKAESKIRQGVTTEVIGNCGFSPAPLIGAAVDEVYADAVQFNLEITWRSMAEYLDRLRKPGTALNVVALVGHNTVRGCVLGYDDLRPTPEQQAQMERVTAEALEQGARGLSTGLFYPPGIYAAIDEVIGLARVTARQGGIYASHIRSESDALFDAVAEAVEIGQRAEVQVEVAHLKLAGYRNWSGVERLGAMLEDARARGVRLGCDQYPYHASNSWLACMLPYWAQAGGAKAVADRLRDATIRARLRQDWEQDRAGWEDRGGMRDWDDIVVSDCTARPEVLGQSLAQIAEAGGKDPLDAAFDLIVASEGQVACVWFDQSEDNVRRLMRHSMVVVGSDGYALSSQGLLSQRKPHPRSYGTFPRVLGRYVRQEKVLSLEEAVKKMTSVTAERFGLADRGQIRQGAWADLVLFDAGSVMDRATFTAPHQYPLGIPYVIVNGQVVIDGGEHTGALPGRVL
ncbi:MAG: N-acyl-D-amino-acid deacylase family protein [Chloroflexota bacterium]